MADIFRLTLLPFLLTSAALMLALVLVAWRKKAYSCPAALAAKELRLHLACLILVNCLATWCFSHCGYEPAAAQIRENNYLTGAMSIVAANLALIVICALPLFYRLQLLLFHRQIALIQSCGMEKGLFVLMNTLLFSILIISTVPLMQIELVQRALIHGDIKVLAGLFQIDIVLCIVLMAGALIAIVLARSGDDVRTLRALKDDNLLPEYMIDKPDSELYPLMAAAKGLLKLNRGETLKAIQSLAPKINAEQNSEIRTDSENEN